MKTKLNILCALIFIAIIASVVDGLKSEWADITWGFHQGWENGDKSQSDPLQENAHLCLRPNSIGFYSDSIYNSASGQWMPLQYREVFVQTEKRVHSGRTNIILTILAFIFVIACLIQFFTFINLIRSINKSVIFAWTNVMKLRVIGYSMLIAFIANTVFAYLNQFSSMEIFDFQGYTIYTPAHWNFAKIIPGLSVLLVAEIFAIGLRMKEEQDLTI